MGGCQLPKEKVTKEKTMRAYKSFKKIIYFINLKKAFLYGTT